MQAGASIWWAAGISGDVRALKEEVERRRGALAIIEGIHNDVARIEAKIGRIEGILDRRGDWRAKIAQIEEHLRTLDARLVRLENL